jgi:hypothetical protein
MGPLSEKSDEKRAHQSVDFYQVDTGAQLVSGGYLPLDQTESLRIRYVSYAGRYSRLKFSNKEENRQTYPASYVQ